MASSITPSSSQGETKKTESQDEVGLVEVDGAIGIYKNRAFQPLTNFGISCKGFVSSGKSVEGYLIEVVPVNCQCLDSSESQSLTYYLTLREMSSQLSILQKIPGQGIWTAPSRDQYLPAYFKEVCDRYLQSEDAKELKPVKRLGYQQGCDPPFWILGRNLQLKVVEGEAIQVPEAESPCCILDGLLKVPNVNLEGAASLKDNLHPGELTGKRTRNRKGI